MTHILLQHTQDKFACKNIKDMVLQKYQFYRLQIAVLFVIIVYWQKSTEMVAIGFYPYVSSARGCLSEKCEFFYP